MSELQAQPQVARLRFGIWGVVLLVTSIAAAFAVWLWLPTTRQRDFVAGWTVTQLVFFISMVLSLKENSRLALNSHRATYVSAGASVVPFVTLLFFLRVFVIGGSSNVRQLAGESGYDLWSLWCGVWPLLYLMTPLAFVVALLATAFPPYPVRYWASSVVRITSVLLAVFAWHTLTTFFPDA